MAGRKKQTRERVQEMDQTLKWLLDFERQAKHPVVVSLLIDSGNISFEACFLKRQTIDDGVDIEGGDENGGWELPEKEKITINANDKMCYFG